MPWKNSTCKLADRSRACRQPPVGQSATSCLAGARLKLFDTAKLLYVMRLLTQPYNSTFKQLATNRLTELRFGRPLKGPLSELWAVARKYHLADLIVQVLDTGIVIPTAKWRRIVTVAAKHHQYQYQLWRMNCMLYKSMNILSQCVLGDGKVGTWWTVAKTNPGVRFACRQLIKLLCADHSLNSRRGRFANHTVLCQLCSLYEEESIAHTLSVCPRLEETRTNAWSIFLQEAPAAMVRDVTRMTAQAKTHFILSGLRTGYTSEWQSIYESLAVFVARLVRERHLIQKDM